MVEIRTNSDSHKGALFPRVHVSETRISGPRAPPRNKMALFEQLTIPPHRFVPPPIQGRSHQGNSTGSRQDINLCFVNPKQLKLRQLRNRDSDVSCGKAKCDVLRHSVAEPRSYSRTSAAWDSSGKDCSSLPSKHASESSPVNSQLKKLWNGSTTESAPLHRVHGQCSPTDVQIQNSATESGHISLSKEKTGSSHLGFTGIEAVGTNKLPALVGAIAENHLNSSPEALHSGRVDNTSLLVGSVACDGSRSAGISRHKGKTLLPIEKAMDGCTQKCNVADGRTSLMWPSVCTTRCNKEDHGDRSSEVARRMGEEQHPVSNDKCDVDRQNRDSLPRIIPKHVMDLIGQREFWEARKTIMQQQKTLSSQIFELHRVIEVQRLIAGMPGLLLEGNSNCTVLKDSTQPGLPKVSGKCVTRESLNREAKHCAKQKEAAVTEPKKLTKLSGGAKANDQCRKPSLKVFPSESVRVSLDQNRVCTWGFIPTPFVENQWLNAGSHNYGLCRTRLTPLDSSFSTLASGLVSMPLQSPIVGGHLYNGQQVWQSSPNVFTNWSRPCNNQQRDPSLASPKLLASGGNLVSQLDYASSAQAAGRVPMPIAVTSALKKPSSTTLNPPMSAQFNKPIGKLQQVASTIERQQASHDNKLEPQPTKSTRYPHVFDKAKPMSLAGTFEIQSKRSELGFQKFTNMVSSKGNEGDIVVQPTRVEDTHAVMESCVADKSDTSLVFPLKSVLNVQEGSVSSSSSRVIRAVPHPASAAVQAAAKILKTIQQNESSKGMAHRK
eukprot:c21817_g1_i1 orf=559-2889(-)